MLGTGLFLGAGQTIAMTGPSILLTYIIIGFMLFMFMRIGRNYYSKYELQIFADVTNTYIGPFAGFVTGWTYWLCWIITGMVEVTAVAKYISFGSQIYLIGLVLYLCTYSNVFQFIKCKVVW